MDITDEEEANFQVAEQRFKERAGFWNPTTKARQKMYLSWIEKQVNQRQKTLELDGATHNKGYKEVLRREKRAYEEEAKRITDLIKDKR